MSGDVQTVQVGQVQVYRHQDRVVFPGRGDALNAVGDGMNIKPHPSQDQLEQIPNILVILDDQAKPA
jgi:hypothetical protein